MKPRPFFITRWWNHLNLQARLFFIFTLLVVFCVLVLSVFLSNVVRMITLNDRARTVFEQNRQVYQLKTLTQQYELDLNQYENNSSPAAQEQISSLRERLDETVASLRSTLPEENAANLDKFSNDLKQLSPLVDQIIAAVDAEDWAGVQKLDGQAYALLDPMVEEVNAVVERGAAELQTVKAEAETFSTLAYASGLLAVPVFLGLFVIAALVVYLQINQPLAQLARASTDLAAGSFRPAEIEDLTGRSDEVGLMAREFVAMSVSVEQRMSRLQQEAGEIRAKIR